MSTFLTLATQLSEASAAFTRYVSGALGGNTLATGIVISTMIGTGAYALRSTYKAAYTLARNKLLFTYHLQYSHPQKQ